MLHRIEGSTWNRPTAPLLLSYTPSIRCNPELIIVPSRPRVQFYTECGFSEMCYFNVTSFADMKIVHRRTQSSSCFVRSLHHDDCNSNRNLAKNRRSLFGADVHLDTMLGLLSSEQNVQAHCSRDLTMCMWHVSVSA